MAERLGQKLGQSVVVDNRPGAGGSVGSLAVAPADGYTLMLSNSTPIPIGPFALEKQPYVVKQQVGQLAPMVRNAGVRL